MTRAKPLEDHAKPSRRASAATTLAAASELQYLIDARLPPITGPDYARGRRAHRTACDQLIHHLETRSDAPRACIDEGSFGTRITMLGYRASSTSGLRPACQNWIAQVRGKLLGVDQ